jgi:hypothetical protein
VGIYSDAAGVVKTYNGANFVSSGTISGTNLSGTNTGDQTNISGNAGTVTINYGNNSNSQYQMLWGSGNSVYGTGNVTINPYYGYIYASVFSGTAVYANYADLAENYVADAQYEAGTVVQFGELSEVTISTVDATARVVGVVSSKPAYLMNNALKGDFVVSVALMGRVPCKVRGPVAKGDMLVATTGGYARAEANPKVGTVIGKSLEPFYGDEGIIEIIVGLK